MKKIQKIEAREILDSRGNPTVEVEITDGEYTVIAKVPSGASTGIHEALELRDGDKARYGGKGVLTAVNNVNKIIAPEICEKFIPEQQQEIDKKMLAIDGTENKSHLGANAILGVSLAAARLAAMQKKCELYEHLNTLFGGKISLPHPMMNVLNGGAHSDSGLAIQEFMIFPKKENFSENLRAGAEIFHTLKSILKSKNLSVGVGDEGGFAPRIAKTFDVFDTILLAIEKANYVPGKDVEFAIDAAASEFFHNGKYTIDGEILSASELSDFYGEIIKKYPIVSIEDSHSEDDFAGFAEMQSRFGDKIQLVGDDLFVTNPKRFQLGIDQKLANSILIKLNQIGTLSETFETIKMAKKENFTTVISHRSGETSDDFISDLAVATNAGQLKTGSLCRSERIEKYNRLLKIEKLMRN
jgi:enolase